MACTDWTSSRLPAVALRKANDSRQSFTAVSPDAHPSRVGSNSRVIDANDAAVQTLVLSSGYINNAMVRSRAVGLPLKQAQEILG